MPSGYSKVVAGQREQEADQRERCNAGMSERVAAAVPAEGGCEVEDWGTIGQTWDAERGEYVHLHINSSGRQQPPPRATTRRRAR